MKGLGCELDISKKAKLRKIMKLDFLDQLTFKLDSKAICGFSNLGPLELDISGKRVITGGKKPANFVILGIFR